MPRGGSDVKDGCLAPVVDRLLELKDENQALRARLDERADADAQRVVDKLFDRVFVLAIENARLKEELAELRGRVTTG